MTVPIDDGGTDVRFAASCATVQVVVVVVTYNSAADIDPLLRSLRGEAGTVSLRVIVADNNSTDSTLEIVARHPDVIALSTGGNLGYAAGINAAYEHLGDAAHVLVLNPDLVVERGAIQAMIERVSLSAAGAVVPRILDGTASTYESLRRDPTVTRSIGDALFGNRFPARPSWLSEIDYHPAHYRVAHAAAWATGAALLVRRDVADAVGHWDERFFLYSEEVDYFRRIRDIGETVWFEPDAVVRHSQGGSGRSPALTALMAVNRIRYVEKRRSAAYAALYRFSVILHELLRSSQADHHQSLGFLLRRNTWHLLPHATGATP